MLVGLEGACGSTQHVGPSSTVTKVTARPQTWSVSRPAAVRRVGLNEADAYQRYGEGARVSLVALDLDSRRGAGRVRGCCLFDGCLGRSRAWAARVRRPRSWPDFRQMASASDLDAAADQESWRISLRAACRGR